LALTVFAKTQPQFSNTCNIFAVLWPFEWNVWFCCCRLVFKTVNHHCKENKLQNNQVTQLNNRDRPNRALNAWW